MQKSEINNRKGKKRKRSNLELIIDEVTMCENECDCEIEIERVYGESEAE